MSYERWTDRDIQYFINVAHALLQLDCAYQNRFIATPPMPFIRKKCEENLKEGKRRGLVPRPDALEWFLRVLKLDADDPYWKAVYQ